MFSGAGALSAFSKIALVDSKIVFKSVGSWISFRSTLFIQGNTVGKIKSSFLNSRPCVLPDLFLKLYNLVKSISSLFSSFLNSLNISVIGCEKPVSLRPLKNDLLALKYKSVVIKIGDDCIGCSVAKGISIFLRYTNAAEAFGACKYSYCVPITLGQNWNKVLTVLILFLMLSLTNWSKSGGEKLNKNCVIYILLLNQIWMEWTPIYD